MDDRYDRNYEKERREAIEAGQRVLNSLRAAQKELESARNWGMVDLFGGGFISSMLKQGKMNTAQNHMEQARYDLQNFSKELRDVERGVDLHINTADCQTAHCGRRRPHFAFGVNTSPIVPYRYLPQTLRGMAADCRSFV